MKPSNLHNQLYLSKVIVKSHLFVDKKDFLDKVAGISLVAEAMYY